VDGLGHRNRDGAVGAGGLKQGFFRSVCSLGGLLLGLVLAAWNYARVAALLMPLVRIEQVSDTIAFILIALFVMALASILGAVMAKLLHQVGLGCLDRIAGAAFASSRERCCDVGYSGCRGFLSQGALASGGQAAQAVFRSVPSEYAHEPEALARRVRED